MPSELNATLKQQGKLGYTREYQLYNERELRINLLAGARKSSYMVHLLALADKSKSRFHISLPWLWCALISAALLAIYWIVRQFVTIDSGIYEFAIVLACLLGIILGSVMLVLNFSRRRVFYSRTAKVPLFDILINKPDKRTYKSFLDTLESCTQKARDFYNLKPDQQIAGEMRMLRRLATEGIISQSVYDNAKDKLFKISNKQHAT